MEKRSQNLDKLLPTVVKYIGIPYRDERKEYRCHCHSENPGRWLEVRICAGTGKCVRERTCTPLE